MVAKVPCLGYEFTPYEMDTTTWNDVGAVYMFCGQNARGEWVIFYAGKAKSASARFSNHEHWQEARTLGATHVLATVVTLEATRTDLERRLIETYRPPLNTMLKP
jgi:excinuclease UvrABC nuclease subunit